MKHFFLITVLGLCLAACGVKSDLIKPDGTATPKNQNDPSKPPTPLGR